MRVMRCLLLLILLVTGDRLAAADSPADTSSDRSALERNFRETVLPFLKTYCASCHSKTRPKADLDLSAYTTLESVSKDHRRWDVVLEQLDSESMPPENAPAHPKPETRRQVIAWIKSFNRYEAARNAGDPGPVFARRLSNAEYDYTIRDLTGADIRPTKEFPVDPANEAGFDNSSESLTMSPALLNKYLDAARFVADHLVLKPEGFSFAPFPVVADTDRDKFVVRRIIDFYQRQPTDYADYFLAAWRFRHRASLGRPQATLEEMAAEANVSPGYLVTIWSVLTDDTEQVGPIAALQALWNDLPPTGDARAGCDRMRDFVLRLRAKLVPEVANLTAPPIHNGSQCLVLWKNRQYVANRRRYAGGALEIKDHGLPADSGAAHALQVPDEAAAKEKYEKTFERFCNIFPDAFVVTERARVYLDPEQEKKLGGRLLSAGFHSMTGYFRDDAPLCDLILDAHGRQVLDRLWQEFDFINGAPMRQYTSFIWFDRTDSRYLRDPEFDRFRAEDKDVTSETNISELAELYLAKAIRNGASETAQEAIRVYFKDISAGIRRVEQARLAAEPGHLAALQAFAARAYRRPLVQSERDDLVSFYRSLRDDEGLSHEEAMRDAIAGVLVSPHFCYRVNRAHAGEGVQPLTNHALASRLSYFLWSSMPDRELLDHAAAGDLHQQDVLVAQARRMMQDGKIRGLAVEFGANWLDFRRFEEHNSVDRGRFASFTDELRQAMFEEPVRFFVDVVQADRSVLDFLYANHTFVNPVLAQHYGMPGLKSAADEWVRIDDARTYGRGGLLPMAVFLTKNAPGLRTSPVKRGYWVVRRLLGETIPAPPAEVPELPNDEAKLGELTLREVLAKHREHKSCSGCHERFDGIGLVFEGYGPIGERRTLDLGGRPVETRATFPGGSEGTGVDGLRAYLHERREQEFVENLCRKLLAYALGRSLLPSDTETVDNMKRRLETDGYRFGVLIETIVLSPQFLNKRGTANAEAALKR
jgi:hypothetical protein